MSIIRYCYLVQAVLEYLSILFHVNSLCPYNLHIDNLSVHTTVQTMWAATFHSKLHTATMFHSTDLYLGTFLILSGFSLSLLNLIRVVKGSNTISTMLLSENVILMCIGIAFVARATYNLNPLNMRLFQMDEGTVETLMGYEDMRCDFRTVLMTYGPLIVSLVNSFVSLIIDNYMHYKMIKAMKKKDEENNVQEIIPEERRLSHAKVKLLSFWKKYYSSVVIVLQWAIPVLLTLFMYPMGVRETVMRRNIQSASDSCMTMMDISNSSCLEAPTNYTLELRKYIPPKDYIQVYENTESNNITAVNSILQNVYRIVYNFTNLNMNVTSAPLYRKPKLSDHCMRICYLETKSMLLYMFILAIVSFFVPITISTIILTKIHVMDVKRPNVKTYVSRELLYNILFWSPVMFDMILSLLFCSSSMDGIRTSLFNVIANVYQAVKNFMNTKYFKDNTIMPA